jgi:hypothetical protein
LIGKKNNGKSSGGFLNSDPSLRSKVLEEIISIKTTEQAKVAEVIKPIETPNIEVQQTNQTE